MTDFSTQQIIQSHWEQANSRDWPSFARLLDPHLQYLVPQTRERIVGGEGYLDMFVTWPGAWRAQIEELVCEGNRAVCRFEFHLENQTETGISFVTLNDQGLISHITEYWPAAYEPPIRASKYMVRY